MVGEIIFYSQIAFHTFPLHLIILSSLELDWTIQVGLLIESFSFCLGVSLLFNKSGLLFSPSFLGTVLCTASSNSIWVEFCHCSKVLERILLPWKFLCCSSFWLYHTLNFIRVNQSGKISICHDVARECVPNLGRFLHVGAIEFVKLLKSWLGPNAESSHMTTRSELQEVQGINTAQLNTRNVAERFVNAFTLVVDDKWTLSGCKSSSSHLPLARTKFFGCLHLLNICCRTNSLQQFNSLGSFCQ
mmetsp:Transcript_29799/g.38327  ORF Transcript_29799/g.38327 Transcript_29799/m.38327 type:complete len:245 (-) Transcript_29799:573-1307(-)